MRRLAPVVLSLLLSAGQSGAGDGRAHVDMNDPATRSAVTAALSDAVGRARIELGPTDGHVLTVLPPKPGPYEGNSPAMPIRFDIEKRDGTCIAVRHDTRQAYDLPGVTCAIG
jgi:hypothetical protein